MLNEQFFFRAIAAGWKGEARDLVLPGSQAQPCTSKTWDSTTQLKEWM